MLDITTYCIPAPSGVSAVLALAADLHNCPYTELLSAIRAQTPDAVVIAGDLMEDTGRGGGRSLSFLRETAAEFPVFYGLGNHEKFLGERDFDIIRETGAHLLIDAWERFGALTIGACAPDPRGSIGRVTPEHHAFWAAFSQTEGFRVLLCHRPDWYHTHIKKYDIPLVLSGHAHGGQIRLLGHPVFSPGQGLFPKYAQGIHDGRLIVSRGLGNHTIVPRFFNAPELCIIRIGAAPLSGQ